MHAPKVLSSKTPHRQAERHQTEGQSFAGSATRDDTLLDSWGDSQPTETAPNANLVHVGIYGHLLIAIKLRVKIHLKATLQF